MLEFYGRGLAGYGGRCVKFPLQKTATGHSQQLTASRCPSELNVPCHTPMSYCNRNVMGTHTHTPFLGLRFHFQAGSVFNTRSAS